MPATDPIPAPAPAPPASVADRLKNCIKIVNSIQPSDTLKKSIDYLFNELLDLMSIAQKFESAQPAPLGLPAPAPAKTEADGSPNATPKVP